MAAALISLIQASLLQQEHVGASEENPPNTSPESTKEWARETLGPVVPLAVKSKDSAPAKLPDIVAGSLHQLMAAVTKLSDLDKTLDLAQQMTPAEGGEALKWHRMSLTAMEWTRKVQSEHVQALLRDLQFAILGRKPAVLEEMLDSANGEACALPPSRPPGVFRPPGVISKATDGDASSVDEAEANVQNHGPVAEELEEENVPIGSLRNDLQRIRDRDPGCCLIVRKIKRLGLESSKLLHEHFGRLGEVEEVCVAHSFEKPNAKRMKHRNGRIRPAALGFIVMATREGAQRALAAGNDQMVGEVTINVRLIEPFDDQPFQPEALP